VTPRQRALALLDVLGVGTDKDQTRRHVERVALLRRCFRGEHPACTLVDALEGLDTELVDRLSKDCTYPLAELAWVFADEAVDPVPREGQLDTHKNQGRVSSPFGEVLRWWSRAETRLRKAIADAETEGDEERAAQLRRTLGTNPRPRSTLVLASDTGPGKSIAAIWYSVHHGGTFYRAAQFGEIPLGEKGKPEVDRLARIPFLIVDELGREWTQGPTAPRVTEVLSLRHDHGRPTIITTQITNTKDFDDRYGHHLRDRIVRGGGAFVVLRGESRRDPTVEPSLHAIRVSARVADLVAAVNASAGRGAHPNERAVEKLARLMGVTDEAIAGAWEKRSAWQAEALRGADQLSELTRGVIERLAGVQP
jgi:hypothetical protein